MKPNTNPQTDQAELEASLARLGIRELEERMEISPLLTDTGTTGTDQGPSSICCTCKIPDPFGPDGVMPYPHMDPGPTGPTHPGGFW
jgi:hypothetical protein